MATTSRSCATTRSSARRSSNGIGAAFKGRVGNYIVYAYDGDPLNKQTLEYRLVVLDANTKEPVYDEHIGVTATWPGYSPAVATVTTFGNVFFYDLPNPYPRHWLMHLTVKGRLGGGRVAYKMHGAAPRLAAPVIVVAKFELYPVGSHNRRPHGGCGHRGGVAFPCTSSPASASTRSERARATLDRIVPTGQPQT